MEIDTESGLVFPTFADADGPFREKVSGEEILTFDTPTSRYGVGVLYPDQTTIAIDDAAAAADPASPLVPETPDDVAGRINATQGRALDPKAETALASIGETLPFAAGGEQDDFDLSTANSFRPSIIAVSLLLRLGPEGTVLITAGGGRYQRLGATVQGRARQWWVRRPAQLRAEVSASELASGHVFKPDLEVKGAGPLNLSVEIHPRPRGSGEWLVTVCLINRTAGTELDSDLCLFQSWLRCVVVGQDSGILAYPNPPHTAFDAEDRSNALLYRRYATFAVGHGCAADWKSNSPHIASEVSTQSMPTVHIPAISADAMTDSGQQIEIPLAKLAGLIPGDDGSAELGRLANSYEAWIDQREAELADSLGQHLATAREHLARCRSALKRIRRGITLLETDPHARRAFQLANHAVLIQQLRYQRESRSALFDSTRFHVSFAGKAPDPNLASRHPRLGRWRAFQIAFLLSSLPSIHNEDDEDREAVELIWFPTGGGKTEAYLALAAYSIIRRRQLNLADAGVQVLMRYTLRLLTAQQFQRAAALITALEHLRRTHGGELGSEPIRIGIWVGASTTPLHDEDAKRAYRQLLTKGVDASNPFLVVRCPWCSAQMGPVRLPGKGAPKLLGYDILRNQVAFRCPDSTCPFRDELPIVVVDDYIYENPPSMIIATVDKFAMLAWQPKARSLFGLDPSGWLRVPPPGLIIQDELHLISGPLGSMVGLYEALIEDLCTRRDKGRVVKPKIVGSTATIRNYDEQIRELFDRSRTYLFPPPGIDIRDSFFARYVDDEPGHEFSKVYLGVHAQGLNSLQSAQIRTYTSLLQSAELLPVAERDPWWTLVCFYNSLRELGGGVSLLQTDIPDYTYALRQREALGRVRYIRRPMELTGRMSDTEVPAAIQALEQSVGDGSVPVDVCLTSNIFEVGMDIDRLSLMAVVGQPKTTSQYIQITGRVGRQWWDRAGLIVTLYSPSKPRDRSHFEQFRSYHEHLYAQVEPTSVTPFSSATLGRGLHAVLVAYCRMRSSSVTGDPYPYPAHLVNEFAKRLSDRVGRIDPEEKQILIDQLKKRVNEWATWQRVVWSSSGAVADPSRVDPPLLIASGVYVPPEWRGAIWPTPQSLRNVDAECQAEITTMYREMDVNAPADS